ncbi:hypothetical protein B0H13DRAFT_2271505 [Mycena leptocephala]|nr:hypothetical protein B0H13DRAFT_2271505 [Mycena leptocephala]
MSPSRNPLEILQTVLRFLGLLFSLEVLSPKAAAIYTQTAASRNHHSHQIPLSSLDPPRRLQSRDARSAQDPPVLPRAGTSEPLISPIHLRGCGPQSQTTPDRKNTPRVAQTQRSPRGRDALIAAWNLSWDREIHPRHLASSVHFLYGGACSPHASVDPPRRDPRLRRAGRAVQYLYLPQHRVSSKGSTRVCGRRGGGVWRASYGVLVDLDVLALFRIFVSEQQRTKRRLSILVDFPDAEADIFNCALDHAIDALHPDPYPPPSAKETTDAYEHSSMSQ